MLHLLRRVNILCFRLKHFERRLKSTKLKLQIFISQTITIDGLISFIEQIIKYNETVTQWEKLNLRQNKNLCCSPRSVFVCVHGTFRSFTWLRWVPRYTAPRSPS